MSQPLHPQGTIRETRIERLSQGLPRYQATYMPELPNRVVVCLSTATLLLPIQARLLILSTWKS